MVRERFGLVAVVLVMLAAMAGLVGTLLITEARGPAPQTLDPPAPSGPLPQYQPPPDSQVPVGLLASPPKHPKFASSVARLVEAVQEVPPGVPITAAAISNARAAARALLDAGLLRLNDRGEVQVYIHVSSSDPPILSELESLGVIVERQDASRNLVQARVPAKALARLADSAHVTAVTPPKYGRVNVGSKLTEGDSLLDFNDVRATFGVDGSGVTVGVISDGIYGLSNAMASGDIPSTTFNYDGSGNLISTSGGVIGTSFRADGDLEAKADGNGAEGTALLEIIHDIAPGAQLRFANFRTDLEFMAAVDFLAANSDVVIDDIGFLGMAYDQTSPVSVNTSTELNRSSNRIRGYYTAAGNGALNHYQEKYVALGAPDPDGNDPHKFSVTSNTTDALGIGPTWVNPILVPNGRTVVASLVWDDTFGAPSSDFDLYVRRNSTGAIVASSTDDNAVVTKEPTEFLAFINNTGSTQYYDIFIINYQGASPAHELDMFVFGGSPLPNGTRLNFNTTRSSISAQNDAGGGVVSVGAISASDPGIDSIEPFSSRGPTNNGVIKPDITAIDGVSVTGSGGFLPPGVPFFGTSASAPHLAGLGALLLNQRPDLKVGGPADNPAADRTTLREAILSTAVDLGASGKDNTFGSGRANGLAAAQALGTPSTSLPLVADFNTGNNGFLYLDDTFRGTGQPAYASGGHVTSGGFNNTGALKVDLGGVNETDIFGMSGGWRRTFSLAVPTEVELSFHYNLTQTSEYESNEVSQVLLSLNGILFGTGGNDYLAQVAGNGNGGLPVTTGWQLATLNLGTLAAGEHTLILGGYNSQKTTTSESTTVLIDDVLVQQQKVSQPPVVNAGSDATINEGGSFSGSGSFTDSDSANWLATVNYGDGSGVQALALNSDKTFNLSHVYADNGSYLLTVTVTDAEGAAGTDTVAVTVNNVAPVVDAGMGHSINEGGSHLHAISFADAGKLDTHTGTVDWGDGSALEVLVITEANGNGGASPTHLYQDNGDFTASFTVCDKDNGCTSATAVMHVANVAPIVNAGPDAAINEGGTFSSSGSFTDPGADTWTATVDYGDGSGIQPLVLNPNKTFSLSHIYSSKGIYTVEVCVKDDDGGQDCDSLIVTVSDKLIEANFDTGTDSFGYLDDTFRGSNNPAYASGSHITSGGFNNTGALKVNLGGVDDLVDIFNGMSGGWRRTFSLTSPTGVELSFRYNLTQTSQYESNEYSQMLLSLDGVLFGTGGNDYLAQIAGDGNGGGPISTGWQLVKLNLGTLAAGEHTLILGGYNNQKTFTDESTTVLIDDVLLAPLGNQAPVVNAGPDQTVSSATLPTCTKLAGSASDDVLPPPGVLTILWSQIIGPDTATFTDATKADTNACFPAAGEYILRLEADDGALKASDDVKITVKVVSGPEEVVLEAETMALSNYIVDTANNPGWIRLSGSATSGTATASFPGLAGSYKLNIHIIEENDGQPTLELWVDGILKATFKYPLGAAGFEPGVIEGPTLTLSPGTEIKLVGKKDGSAFARLDKIIFTPDTTPPSDEVILEAEQMTLIGYSIDTANNPGWIRLAGSATSGTATAAFSGPAGTYKVQIHAIIENDGQPTLQLWVGGVLQASFTYPLGSAGFEPGVLEGPVLALSPGTEVKLVGTKNGSAFARLDKITFIPDTAPPTVTIEAEQMALSNYSVDTANNPGWIRLAGSATSGTATASFSGPAGSYKLNIHIIEENDGQPTLELWVDGILKATFKYPLGTAGFEPGVIEGPTLALRPGTEVMLVGKKDGSAFARLDKIVAVEVGP